MGIFFATQLGILILARLFIHVKTGQLLPVAISEKPAMRMALQRHVRRIFSVIRSEYR